MRPSRAVGLDYDVLLLLVRSVDRIFRDTRIYQRVVTRFGAQRRSSKGSQSEPVLARQNSATQTLDLARGRKDVA